MLLCYMTMATPKILNMKECSLAILLFACPPRQPWSDESVPFVFVFPMSNSSHLVFEGEINLTMMTV